MFELFQSIPQPGDRLPSKYTFRNNYSYNLLTSASCVFIAAFSVFLLTMHLSVLAVLSLGVSVYGLWYSLKTITKESLNLYLDLPGFQLRDKDRSITARWKDVTAVKLREVDDQQIIFVSLNHTCQSEPITIDVEVDKAAGLARLMTDFWMRSNRDTSGCLRHGQ